MLLKIIRFLRGSVDFTASGKFPERFMNITAKNGVNLWNPVPKKNAISASMYLSDYKKIRILARKSRVKTRITAKHGLPFIINRYKKRTGLFAAAKNIQAYTTPTSGSKAFVIRKNTGVKILNFWIAGNKMYIRVKNGSKTGWIKAVTFKESQGHAGSPQFSRVMYTG